MAILAGLVRCYEVSTGEIKDVLRIAAPRTRRDYVWPARNIASELTGLHYPPMGRRFRLRADFDPSGLPSEAQVILRAMKEYGIILADNGLPWFISGGPDERWDNDKLVNELHQLRGADFEAVGSSSLMIVPDSAQVRHYADQAYLSPAQDDRAPNWQVSPRSCRSWLQLRERLDRDVKLCLQMSFH